MIKRICTKCGREGDGDFCVHCGNTLKQNMTNNIGIRYGDNNKSLDTLILLTSLIMYVAAALCAIYAATVFSALVAVIDYAGYSDISDVVLSIGLTCESYLILAIGFAISATVFILRRQIENVKKTTLIIIGGYFIALLSDTIFSISFDTFLYILTFAIWALYVLPTFEKFKRINLNNKSILVILTSIMLILRIANEIIDEASGLTFATHVFENVALIFFGMLIIRGLDKKLEQYVAFKSKTVATYEKEIHNNVFVKSELTPIRESEIDKVKMLRELKSLLDEGIITEEEFNYKKKEIL